MRDLGNTDKREMGRWANNLVESSHLPFRHRERKMSRSRQMEIVQKFASVPANIHSHLTLESHLIDRKTYKTRYSAALTELQNLVAKGVGGRTASHIGGELRLDWQHLRRADRPDE